MKRKYFKFYKRSLVQLYGMFGVRWRERLRFKRTAFYRLYHNERDLLSIIPSESEKSTGIRFLFFYKGSFRDDETFEWLNGSMDDIECFGINFTLNFFIKKSEKGDDYKSVLLKDSRIIGDNFLIIEVIAFSDVDLLKGNKENLQNLLEGLHALVKAKINNLFILHKVKTGSIEIDLADNQGVVFNIAWLSRSPYDHVDLIVLMKGSYDFYLRKKVEGLNTLEIFETFNECSNLDFEITFKVVEAVRFRFQGEYSIVPMLCHLAIENLLKILIKEKILVKNDKFKDKMNSMKNMGSAKLSQMIDLYCDYVYKIRNNSAHRGESVSNFLADYSVYVTVNLILHVLKSKLIQKTQLSSLNFPFMEVDNIGDCTITLKKIYGHQLKGFSSWPK